MFEPAVREIGAVFLVTTTSLRLPTLMVRALQVMWWATHPGRPMTSKEWARPGYTRKYGHDTSLIQENLDAPGVHVESFSNGAFYYAARTDIQFINR
jgi:hypothetical protein